jgi:hypothetical protein
MEMIEEFRREYPHRKFYLDGDTFAIMSEPKEVDGVIED